MLYNNTIMNDYDVSEIILRRIVAVNTVQLGDGKVFSRTLRPAYALAMKIAGRTVYTSGGKQYVSDPTHMVMLGKSSDYRLRVEEKGKCIMIEFDAETDETEPLFAEFPLDETASREVAALFLSAANVWDMKKDNYALKCKAIFYKILDKATAHKKQEYLPSSYRRMLDPVIDYIRANYGNREITNESLAAIAGTSTVYFRKIFTKAFGVPPIKYLRSVRIKKATELLIGDVASVSEIADSTGFGSLYNFSKTFKLETGVSPREYAAAYSARK